MGMVDGLLCITWLDGYRIPGSWSTNIQVDDTKTVAQLIADAGTGGGLTDALSQGHMIRTEVRLFQAIENDTPGAGDIEKGGLFNFNDAASPYADGNFIPDINPAILTAGGLIDLTNATVTDWITWMTTAHTAITVLTKGLRALTSLRDALISFRKHRKPLARKTKEV